MRIGLGETPELDELLSLFRTGHNRGFTIQMPSLSILDDPDEDKYIEAAVALDAEAIVSVDRHLKKIQKYTGITIVAPKEVLSLHCRPAQKIPKSLELNRK